MDAIVKGNNQLGVPTRAMIAGRAFRHSNPHDSTRIDKVYRFRHGTMRMNEFIEKSQEGGAVLDKNNNLTWDNETIGLTASALRYYKFLLDYRG